LFYLCQVRCAALRGRGCLLGYVRARVTWIHTPHSTSRRPTSVLAEVAGFSHSRRSCVRAEPRSPDEPRQSGSLPRCSASEPRGAAASRLLYPASVHLLSPNDPPTRPRSSTKKYTTPDPERHQKALTLCKAELSQLCVALRAILAPAGRFVFCTTVPSRYVVVGGLTAVQHCQVDNDS